MAAYEARGCRGAVEQLAVRGPEGQTWTPNPIKRARILLIKDWLRNSIRALLILLKRNALSGSAPPDHVFGRAEAVRRMAPR
jgi:hypothetical protein